MKIHLLSVLIMTAISFLGCAAQAKLPADGDAAETKLPKEMPADVVMIFSSNGGMTLYYTNIEISGETLTYKAKTPVNKGKEVIWTAKISPADKAGLYSLFVENNFDRIKNEKNETITFDAGSEGVNVSFASGINFYVQSGANFPLSAENKPRYQIVAGEFGRLAAKYQAIRENPGAAALAEARSQAASLFEKINTDKTGKTMYQLKFTPFFPTEWNGAKPSQWISYVYAGGFEPGLMDGERTSKPFAKIVFDPAAQTAAFEKLSDKLEDGGVQGIKPLPQVDLAVLKTAPQVEKTILQTKNRAGMIAKNTVGIAAFYQIWEKYNGTVFQQFAAGHGAFNQWVDERLFSSKVRK